MQTWFYNNSHDIFWILISSVLFYIITVAVSKLVGIRSFTTASSFDFLITLAIGALLASTIADNDISLIEGTTALLSLYGIHTLITYARQRWSFVKKIIDNRPVLLMKDGQILKANMRFARITEYELRAKLREHNVINYGQVLAAVLEVNGNISVLTRRDPEEAFDPALLRGVLSTAKEGETH
jgi:uncharacterized membrane protein YcaP (DUF421 family)